MYAMSAELRRIRYRPGPGCGVLPEREDQGDQANPHQSRSTTSPSAAKGGNEGPLSVPPTNRAASSRVLRLRVHPPGIRWKQKLGDSPDSKRASRVATASIPFRSRGDNPG